jgi:hypothetical protein
VEAAGAWRAAGGWKASELSCWSEEHLFQLILKGNTTILPYNQHHNLHDRGFCSMSGCLRSVYPPTPPPHHPCPLQGPPRTSPVGTRSSGLAASAPTPHSLRSSCSPSSSSSSSVDPPDPAAAPLSLSESSWELLPPGPSSSESSSELLLTSAAWVWCVQGRGAGGAC